jgi:class 3 adenylate cyclase
MGIDETRMEGPKVAVYLTPPPSARSRRQLVTAAGTRSESRYTFYDSIEIGRYQEGAPPPGAGILLIQDATVSSRHCIVTQTDDGLCFVRDVSRNGTRLDGRRLLPNLEVEMKIGQVLSVGTGQEFRLEGKPDSSGARPRSASTMVTEDVTTVTVLVGDIQGFTGLVQTVDFNVLQKSVSLVFGALEEEVNRLGGTIKEYPGDAIFAFWEETNDGHPAVGATRAAVVLDVLARRLAQDPSIWSVPGYPLRMDWALATGEVSIHNLGGDRPKGLSMIGEPVVLAFRLEKMANDSTGSILACSETVANAGDAQAFDELGLMEAEGFDKPCRVFALRSARANG